MYNASTLRALNMLIETSNAKIPHSHLGTSKKIFDDDVWSDEFKHFNGHIARNIRLALMAIELVQPYVSIWGVNAVPLKNDVVPMVDIGATRRDCMESKTMRIPAGQKDGGTTIAWTVGSGFSVDYTTIMYAKWEDVPDAMGCNYQPSYSGDHNEHSEIGRVFRTVEATSGPTKWKGGWREDANLPPVPPGWKEMEMEMEMEDFQFDQPLYSATIDIVAFEN